MPVGGGSILATGARVDRFELVARVHHGGRGSVWLATERAAAGGERRVALRVVDSTGEPHRLREMILQEVKLAASIAHANVAQIVDVGESGRTTWIASEWVEGVSLAELLAALEAPKVKSVEMPPAILLRVLANALAGLHAGHLLRDHSGGLLNVVHGDLSPRSIVIAANGVGRVVDFGFAKARAREAGAANGSWRLGQGEGALVPPPGQRIDRHADVWAIGAILERALGDGTPAASVPAIVRDLAHRAMATDPLERFATAAEMQGAIEAAMVTLGISTTSATVAAFVTEHGPRREPARVAAIDSLPATAHSLGPSPLVLSTPLAPQRALLDSQELTGDAFAQYVMPVDAVAAGRAKPPAPAPRKSPAPYFIGGFAGVVAVGVIAFGIVQATSASTSTSTSTPTPTPTSTPTPTPTPPPNAPCPSGMVEIPGGKFYMGSDEDLDIERPSHHVVLAPYCISAFEVTAEQYKACSDAGDCKRAPTENKWSGLTKADSLALDPLCTAREPESRARHPINCVDWDMAALYCKTRGARLPTEAEWELAARGPDGRRYPWGDAEPNEHDLNVCGHECALWGKKGHLDLGEMHDGDDGWVTTAPVGSFPDGRSPYGVSDLAGNVSEWTADWFAPYDEGASENPKGPANGSDRVIRGGAWNASSAAEARPTFRGHADPSTRSHAIGFRCAR